MKKKKKISPNPRMRGKSHHHHHQLKYEIKWVFGPVSSRLTRPCGPTWRQQSPAPLRLPVTPAALGTPWPQCTLVELNPWLPPPSFRFVDCQSQSRLSILFLYSCWRQRTVTFLPYNCWRQRTVTWILFCSWRQRTTISSFKLFRQRTITVTVTAFEDSELPLFCSTCSSRSWSLWFLSSLNVFWEKYAWRKCR